MRREKRPLGCRWKYQTTSTADSERKGKDKKRQYTANTTYHVLKPKMWVVGKRTWGHMSFAADAGVLWCPRHNMTVETEPSACRTMYFFFLPDSVRCVFATGGSSLGISRGLSPLRLCVWLWLRLRGARVDLETGRGKKTYPKPAPADALSLACFSAFSSLV